MTVFVVVVNLVLFGNFEIEQNYQSIRFIPDAEVVSPQECVARSLSEDGMDIPASTTWLYNTTDSIQYCNTHTKNKNIIHYW